MFIEKNEIEIGKEYHFSTVHKNRYGKLAEPGNVIVLDIMPVAQPHPYGKYAVLVKYSKERLINNMWVGINELS